MKKLNDTLATGYLKRRIFLFISFLSFILEGDFVTLECLVISTTPVHATWFKNNIPLQDSADCRQIQEDKRFKLVIKVCLAYIYYQEIG